MVSQEPILFEGSISENIKLGKIEATEEEIIQAAKVANAHNFVQELPQVVHNYLIFSFCIKIHCNFRAFLMHLR